MGTTFETSAPGTKREAEVSLPGNRIAVNVLLWILREGDSLRVWSLAERLPALSEMGSVRHVAASSGGTSAERTQDLRNPAVVGGPASFPADGGQRGGYCHHSEASHNECDRGKPYIPGDKRI